MAFKISLACHRRPYMRWLKVLLWSAISAYYNYAFEKIAPNIITQAVALTFSVVTAMYLLYKFNIINATPFLPQR